MNIKEIDYLYNSVIDFSQQEKSIASTLSINVVKVYINKYGAEITFRKLRLILGNAYDGFMNSLEGDTDPGSYFNEHGEYLLAFEKKSSAELFCKLLKDFLVSNRIDPELYVDHLGIPFARHLILSVDKT